MTEFRAQAYTPKSIKSLSETQNNGPKGDYSTYLSGPGRYYSFCLKGLKFLKAEAEMRYVGL